MADNAQQALHDDLYAKAATGGAVFLLVLVAGYTLGLHPPYDRYGDLIGRDFGNTWIGARAALTGRVHALFDYGSYLKLLNSVFGPLPPAHNWSYPPHILLFVWPLGFLPYLAAYALWSVLGALCLAAAAFEQGDSWWKLLFVLAAPAAALNLFCGQNGAFTAALLIVAFTRLERRPLVSGVCFALLTLKPQLGLLIPLALLLQRRWRCLAAATFAAAAFLALTGAIFGFSVWSGYIGEVLPFQREVMNFGTGLMPPMMPTAFMNARVLGLSHHFALVAQAPFTLAAFAAVLWTYSVERDRDLSTAVLLTACFVATPYLFGYDLVVLGWLLWRLRPHFSSTPDQRLALAVWTLPVTTILLGACHIPGSALVLPVFLLRLVWKLRQQEELRLPVSPEVLPA